MDEKLESEIFTFWEQSGQASVENGAILTAYSIYSDILQNAPFRSQIFKIFFASGCKGALTPLTEILRTPLSDCSLSGQTLPFVDRAAGYAGSDTSDTWSAYVVV